MGALCIIWKKEPFSNRHCSVECSLLRLCVHFGVVLSCHMNRVLYSNVSIFSQCNLPAICSIIHYLPEAFKVMVGSDDSCKYAMKWEGSVWGAPELELPLVVCSTGPTAECL